MGDHTGNRQHPPMAREPESHWEHYAHYAHHLHLCAEGGEAVAESVEHFKHVRAAAKLAKTHAQMAYDLRRMGRNLDMLERVAKEGGARGRKAAEALNRAKAAFVGAKSEFEAERTAVTKAQQVLREFKLVPQGAKGSALTAMAKAAASFEAALSTSRVGSKLLTLGRITTSPRFVRGLVVVGAACEGVASYADSTAQTTAGKTANAVLGAGAGALTMMNPYVAAADVIAPKGYKLSELYHGSAGAVTAIGESAITGDCKPVDDFHRRSMKGHYGKVLQAASDAGEFWAKKGIAGGLQDFGSAIRWWVTH